MFEGKFCEDCTHYKDINYFLGHCEKRNEDEAYYRPVDNCNDFECKARGNERLCKVCKNKERCY